MWFDHASVLSRRHSDVNGQELVFLNSRISESSLVKTLIKNTAITCVSGEITRKTRIRATVARVFQYIPNERVQFLRRDGKQGDND